MKERIQKIMAHAGVASRRKSEQMIQAGKVSVNGKIVTELGVKADPEQDVIRVNGKLIQPKQEHYYLIINKPQGYLTTVSDDRGRKTVLDLIPKLPVRIYPVGRLDYDSQGLVLLTNDGNLAYRLMHPKFHIRKVYLVTVNGMFNRSAIEKMRSGIKLEDGITQEAEVNLLKASLKKSIVRIGLYEGRNRQIRRMCSKLGFKAKTLIRIQIGPIKLADLDIGAYRLLNTKEIKKLKQAVELGEQ